MDGTCDNLMKASVEQYWSGYQMVGNGGIGDGDTGILESSEYQETVAEDVQEMTVALLLESEYTEYSQTELARIAVVLFFTMAVAGVFAIGYTIPDFCVEIVTVPSCSRYTMAAVSSPSIVLVLEGQGTLFQTIVTNQDVGFSHAGLVSANTNLDLLGGQEGIRLARAFSNVFHDE